MLLEIVYIIILIVSILFITPKKYMNKVLTTKQANRIQLYKTLLKLFLKTCTFMAFQRFSHKNVIRVAKNTYNVSFAIGSNLYTIQIKCKGGPSNVIQIIDENDNDITDIISPFINFSENTEIIIPTLESLGYKSATYNMATGDELERIGSDSIITEI